MTEHAAFLLAVQRYVSQHPEAGAYVSDYVAKGIESARMEAVFRAADMEAALAVALAKKYRNREAIILEKLRRWQGRSSLRWDDVIAKLSAHTVDRVT